MRLSRLPSRVMKALGIDWPGGQVPNALKLVQAQWCAPLDYQTLCPRDCRLCEAKLADIARITNQNATRSKMGLWKFVLREEASIKIEEARSKKGSQAGGSLAEAAAQMLQEMGVG
jgi:hypothetical protein